MVNPTKSVSKAIYTTHEVSRLLHVNPRSVINWIEQSLLSSYRTPGGHRRIRHDDLLAFLRKHQIPTPASLVSGSFNVLIVDDEKEIIDIMKTFLQRQGGYEISSASDGVFENALVQTTNIFIEQDGNWYMVHHHGSHMPSSGEAQQEERLQ